jgi:hypothetical protein
MVMMVAMVMMELMVEFDREFREELDSPECSSIHVPAKVIQP